MDFSWLCLPINKEHVSRLHSRATGDGINLHLCQDGTKLKYCVLGYYALLGWEGESVITPLNLLENYHKY